MCLVEITLLNGDPRQGEGKVVKKEGREEGENERTRGEEWRTAEAFKGTGNEGRRRKDGGETTQAFENIIKHEVNNTNKLSTS